MIIVTNPLNIDKLDTIANSVKVVLDYLEMAPVKANREFPVQFDNKYPEKTESGKFLVVDKCRFSSYDLDKPRDWEIFARLVEPEMVPAFSMINDRSVRTNESGPTVKFDRVLQIPE